MPSRRTSTTTPSPSNSVDAVAHTGVNPTNLFKPSVDMPTEHADIIAFIKNSYSRKPPLLKIDELRWRFAIRSVLRGENLLIRGDTGCGKTMLAKSVASAMERPFFYFNMGATQDARSTLIGNVHFKEGEGTYVAESHFVHAIQTPKAIILLDEFTRAHPDAHNILMPVLDQGQRYLRIDERPDTPTIHVAEGVSFIGTANVGTEYTATRQTDRAMMDRWTVLMMELLSKDDEFDLLTKMFPNVDADDLANIADIAEFTRNDVRGVNPRLSTALSTRTTTEMAALMYDGFSLVEAAEVKIFPLYSDVGGPDSQRSYMRKRLQQYVQDPASAKTVPNFTGDPNGGAATPWG